MGELRMKILGIDYGRKKVGIAIGNVQTGLVESLLTANTKNLESKVVELCFQEKVNKIVIGLPGGRIDKEIRNFGEKIKKETNLPLVFFDETLTTLDARKILGKIGRKRRYKKEKEDAVAAAIMLELFMEGR